MATQKNTFMETDHPLVRRIWKILEQGVPAEFENEINLADSTLYQKSVAASTNLRCHGTISYKKSKYGDAMTYYSNSAAYAPAGSKELALAYGNRSSVSQYGMLYDLCVLDANRALAGPLTRDVRDACLLRRAVAWKKLQEQNALRIKMWKDILRIKRSRGQVAELNACERRLGYVSTVGFGDVDLVIDHSQLDDPIWNTTLDNTVPRQVSPKIVLRLDARLGPHWVATEDIEPGEVLCTDEFYSCTLNEHVKSYYCDYCHFQCDTLIPCTNCTWDMYCSTTCRLEAHDSYHRTECQILSSWSHFDESTRELYRLLLRAFLRVTKQGAELANLMNSAAVCAALDGKLDDANVPFTPESYPIFANVVSRLRFSNQENMAYDSMMISATLAIFAGLRSVRFFGNEDTRIQGSSNVLNEEEYFGIMLLVNQVSLMIPQPFRLGEYLVDSLAQPSSAGTYRTMGLGISLWQCLTLHSCDPNVLQIVNKRHMLIYSAKYIRAGEQISPWSLADFAEHPREVRRDIHKNVGCPECACEACAGDWPTLTELLQRNETYRTDDETIIRAVEKARQWLTDNRTPPFSKDDPEIIIEIQKVLREYVEEPSATIVLCFRYIQRMMLLKGDLRLNPK